MKTGESEDANFLNHELVPQKYYMSQRDFDNIKIWIEQTTCSVCGEAIGSTSMKDCCIMEKILKK